MATDIGQSIVNSKLRFVLVLDGRDNVCLRLAFLHACMISVHKLRGPHFEVPVVNRERYIRANFRDDLTRCKPLKDAFNDLWKGRD